MLDPNEQQSSSRPPMTAYSPVSLDQTVPSSQSQANTTPRFDSGLDQLGQHFLLVADAANKFSIALQQALKYLA